MDSGPPFLCVNTNQWRLAGTRQPMGGYFAVSTLLFYFSCDLHQSKKVRTRRRGILGMNMNTEIMWIDFIILLRLSAFCRQAFFVVFLGFVSAVDHLLYLSLATQRWNRRCSAWILPKEFFSNYQLYFSWACVLCFLMVYHIDETVDIRGFFRHEQENRLLQYIVLCW